MAKLPTKKKEKTPEEQAAELAAMMGDVSPIRLTPNAVQPAASVPASPPSAPSVSPTKPAVSETPAPASPALPAAVPAPLAADQLPTAEPVASDRGGAKKKSAPLQAPPQPAPPAESLASAAPVAAEEVDDDELAEQTPPEPTAAPMLTAGASYDVHSLFVPTKDKKTVMFRITPAMHQYFQQIGMILGNGASVPDVVHNILTQWRAEHGAQVQKAMQKQLRQMLKS